METSRPRIKLIIGLGNPGPKYKNTYHNVGANFAEYFRKLRNSYRLIPEKLAVLASTLYVNESGKFVLRELKRQGIDSENLLVVQDDSDLEIGQYKFTKPGHSAAGHHGIESIQEYIPNNFQRLRIGIRPPSEKVRQKADKFVLKQISVAHHQELQKVFEGAIKDLEKQNLPLWAD